MTNPFLLTLGAAALLFVLLVALVLRRLLRARAAAPAARPAELSMRETLARRVRDGEEFTL